ncbi:MULTISPECIES: YegS/Rv2252/BmrU family lipid kinase [unclassified Lactobacillus]|uniref:diacylglycerol/lipid kinase family protein n=1 Tax=unclassified Lactobacillus TaxID=2620435 RepID=UPI0023F7A75F|nr:MULTISPECIES: YegS/Rv2252/BmrU family lipid kinase [unclassified Lactobacillus]MDF7668417.1 YegS/Rv2252/BmrU family lipid kinase [Lactobacillus sp. ESL0703]WEV39361.1 YegS/Rv2252/BmrU family lipid kinase [Lactobacillus sp. ESL0680]
MKLHLLVNETAGNGQGKKSFTSLVQLLVDANINFSFQKSTYAGELIKLAQDYSNQKHEAEDVLLIIGGDGSLNEVLNGIKRSANPETPFAYLPAGTGNDFARAAELTTDPEKLLHSLQKSPVPLQIDCGKFQLAGYKDQPSYFANSFGIGFDASVNHFSNHSKLKEMLNKLHEGKLIYGANILRALRSQDTFSIEVRSANQKMQFDDAFLVTTTNQPYFGGGFPLLPSASLTSHRIDTIVVEKFSIPKLLKLLYHLLKDGSHINDPQFHYIEAKEIIVKTKQKEFAQVDGEEINQRTFNLKLKVSHFNLLK